VEGVKGVACVVDGRRRDEEEVAMDEERADEGKGYGGSDGAA
jgi:hypothetical protein